MTNLNIADLNMADLNLNHADRWDIAGIDGLQVARSLFGDSVSQIAPFQSIETKVGGCACSILRLCEGNFRIVGWGRSTDLKQVLQHVATQYRVWVRQFDWLSAIVIPESVGLAILPKIATTKPPYRLRGIGSDRAVPARIEGISVLIWRHVIAGMPVFELHTATQDTETIRNLLELAI